jgi:predicted HicB family RNase H-like nuclease
MSVMSYKGYKARVAFDAEDEIFVGHLAGINDVVGFGDPAQLGAGAAGSGSPAASADRGPQPRRGPGGPRCLKDPDPLRKAATCGAAMAGS